VSAVKTMCGPSVPATMDLQVSLCTRGYKIILPASVGYGSYFQAWGSGCEACGTQLHERASWAHLAGPPDRATLPFPVYDALRK